MPPKLSVLTPIFNERSTLPVLLDRVRAVELDLEIILVDDGSSDGTREYLRDKIEGRYPDVKVFYHAVNRGKGAAIRTALQYATGTYCIVQDGDLEYNPQDYIPILETFEKEQVSVVYGSRFLRGWPPMRLPYKIVNKLLAAMVRVLYRTPLTDEATCYKAFRTDVLRSIPLVCTRFEFCPEVTAKLIRRGYRIAETPINYTARSSAQGKKIRWTDGVEAIWTLLKYRFVSF